MESQLLLYISAATDLELERETLGRAITEIPVDLGWRVEQSPRKSQPLNMEAVVKADIHLLLMSGDIRAPIGQEWRIARHAGRRPALFLKQDVVRTPAALNFIRYIQTRDSWDHFKSAAELRQKALLLCVDYIRDHAVPFGLSPRELKRLDAFRRDLEKASDYGDDAPGGGAGESGVILSRERYLPSEGVLIQPKKDRAQRPGRDS